MSINNIHGLLQWKLVFAVRTLLTMIAVLLIAYWVKRRWYLQRNAQLATTKADFNGRSSS